MELYLTESGIMRFNEDKTRQFIKFSIMNNRLYAYNIFEKYENRRYIEIKKINGIKVKTLLEKGLREQDFFNPALMRHYGIDIVKKFEVTFKQIETTKYDLYRSKLPKHIFYKPHKKSNILNISTSTLFASSKDSNNKMLDYASTSFKCMINMLYNMSKSESDKEILGELIDTLQSVNRNFTNTSGNQDMIYLSTLLLLEEKNYEYIPEYISERILALPLNIREKIIFLDENYECNSSILTDGEPDPRKIIRMLRNSIAHSNYEMIDANTIRVFNERKNNYDFNILIGKKTLLYILRELHDFNNLEDVLPVIRKSYTDNQRLTIKTLIDYLLDIDVYTVNKIEIKNFNYKERYDEEINVLSRNVSSFKQISSWTTSPETIEETYERYIAPILSPDCELQKRKLTSKDIRYILNEIDQHDKENFFSLSKSTQVQVIDTIIKKRFNKLGTYHNLVIDNIVINNGFNNESLNINSHSYINYKAQLELTILSLLNSIFLYSFNGNKSGLELADVFFPRYVYETYLANRVNRLKKISEDKVKFHDEYIAILKVVETFDLEEDYINEPIKQIDKLNNQAIKVQGQIGSADTILYGLYNEVAYEFVHTDIFNRIRDSLAHGKVKIRNLDIYDIGNADIYIEDEYLGITEFKGVIKLRDILKAISHEEVLRSMLNDNVHFNKHTLKKR